MEEADRVITKDASTAGKLLGVLKAAAGLAIVYLFLHIAGRVTRDCTVGLFVYDICSWVSFREFMGLPASKFLRAIYLEAIGLFLLAGIFLTIRYTFPFRRKD
jgi:hypothetical protein